MSTILLLVFIVLVLGTLAWIETHMDWIRMELSISDAIQRSYVWGYPSRRRG